MNSEPSTRTTWGQQPEALVGHVDGPAAAAVVPGMAHPAAIVSAARAGDRDAWESLVTEYSRMLSATTRRYRLNDAEAADAVQLTWLRLLENLDQIRDPDRLAGWLATTVRRICLDTACGADRRRAVDDPHGHAQATLPCAEGSEASDPEQAALRDEHVALVRRVLAELPERHQHLMRLLMSCPAPSYSDVAAELGMPVGSIGPTRARILARMRARLASLGLEDPVLA